MLLIKSLIDDRFALVELLYDKFSFEANMLPGKIVAAAVADEVDDFVASAAALGVLGVLGALDAPGRLNN